MAELAYLDEDDDLKLSIAGGGELELPAAKLEDVAFRYPRKELLFSKVNLRIDGKSRICILGENGIDAAVT